MHLNNLHIWQHDHVHGQDLKRPGEQRTVTVIVLTSIMMVVEIIAGIIFGSMALLADGLHMASHAVALSVAAVAYIYARHHAHDERYSFGTGKVNALGGFSGAMLLAVFAAIMALESFNRLFHPVKIIFNQAILVATIGLLVNGICAFILGVTDHDHSYEDHHNKGVHHHDHNLKAAYLHVMADALTSVLAIVALLAAKYFRFMWMDPVMGIVGALLVSKWSFELLRFTGGILLDRQGPEPIRRHIKESVEGDGDSRVADLHVWSIGPSIYACEIAVVAHNPATPIEYKERISKKYGLAHVSIEAHQCSTTEQEKGDGCK